MKIYYQCSNCGKREKTSAMAGIPDGMFALNYRAVGDALYCPDCVNSWYKRNGKAFDEQYPNSVKMFCSWWNNTVKKEYGKCNKEISLTAKQVCRKAVIKYGDDEQMRIAQEECAELIQAISKCHRYGLHGEHLQNLIEEMADVVICIEQLKVILKAAGIDESEFDDMVDRKIARIEKRLESGDEK